MKIALATLIVAIVVGAITYLGWKNPVAPPLPPHAEMIPELGAPRNVGNQADPDGGPRPDHAGTDPRRRGR